MAIYSKPAEVPRRKGSLGGSTFTRTCNGFVIRKRYTPKQPRTIAQLSNRNKFASAAQHFRTLSGTQKNTFQVSANQFPLYDSLGNEYFLNGQQQNNKLNQNLQLADQNKISQGVAPFAFPVHAIVGGGANVSPPLLQIAVTPDPIPVPLGLLIYSTPVGYYSFESIPYQKLRLLATLPPGTTGVLNLIPSYVATFGQPTLKAGLQIVVGIKLLHGTRGL